MNNKAKRITLIVLMLAILAYTVINYLNHAIDQTKMLVLSLFLGWLLISQIYALIREWKEE